MIRFVVAFLIILGGVFLWAIFSPVTLDSGPVTIAVESGWSEGRIIKELERAGLLKSSLFSRLYLLFTNKSNVLQAGTYTFEGRVSAHRIFSALVSGSQAFREKSVILIEGWRVEDMAKYLEQEGILPRLSFVEAATKSYPFPAVSSLPQGRTLEGYLFPDTYRVFHDSTAEELVSKMLENFESKVTDEMRRALEKDGRTLDQAVILASILERELTTYDDKRRAAGVFLNRFKAGIPFQADSTVNYVTGKTVTRASSEDIKIDSPYNTYKYRGFPPGPISNPGLDSIKAAIYSEQNGYYYFLTTPDGHALFSKTIDEHNVNKLRYYP